MKSRWQKHGSKKREDGMKKDKGDDRRGENKDRDEVRPERKIRRLHGGQIKRKKISNN